jgi:transaldolase
MTSNPTIFAKAISGPGHLRPEFASLIATKSVEDAYWDLVVDDINGALNVLRPVYDSSRAGTASSRWRWPPRWPTTPRAPSPPPVTCTRRIDRPNLLVKIPATEEGVPAIEQMISEGHSINVTLIFSLARYDEVIEAYLVGPRGLAASAVDDLSSRGQRGFVLHQPGRHRGRPPHRVGRADGGRRDKLLALRGKAAVAQARSWPTSSSPTGSPGHAGRRWRPRAPGSSGRCGPRRRPRTRPTPTSPTSTA